MASRAAVPFLVGMMLLTGVCNTLLTKYQDNQCVGNCDDVDPRKRQHFEQPVLQTAQMFVGEMGCWLVVAAIKLCQRYTGSKGPVQGGYQALETDDFAADDERNSPENHQNEETPKLRGLKLLYLALPAVCDICGTTLMNGGLLLVAASIYQMTRGALVLFVGLLSVLFLRRHLHLFQWLSLLAVALGVAIVGLAGAITPGKKVEPTVGSLAAGDGLTEAGRVIIGVLLIAGAQIFTASQFVVEEWILEKWRIEPLKVVGWEGIFGFVITCIAMIVLHLAVGGTDAGHGSYFDMLSGWRQMTSHRALAVSSVLIMISIGGFNFFGLSVTRSVSATSRSTIDTCRTLFIWIVSLGLGWESFKWLQIVGFALLVYATFVFNGLVHPPLKSLRPNEEVGELLPEEPLEHN